LLDLNFVIMWYLTVWINFVCVLILDLPQLFGSINYSMIDMNVILCNVYLKVVELNFWYATCIWWLLILERWSEYVCVWLKYDKCWWMRCWFYMNKHWWYSLDGKVVRFSACVVHPPVTNISKNSLFRYIQLMMYVIFIICHIHH